MADVPEKIWLYRMIHWKNVEHVLDYGICCSKHPDADLEYINIGMKRLIDDRHDYHIPLQDSGKLGEYIPFYFAGHSPMLYLIKNGYKGVEKRPQEDIIYIITDHANIKNASLSFVFTDRNAKLALANYYDDEKDFTKLDWKVIRSKNWQNDNENLDRQDLKQAEYLVHHHVPISCIKGFAVLTTDRKEYLEELIRQKGHNYKVYLDNNRKLYY